MGREIKRVPLDFKWPINSTIWKGYHNPYSGLKCQPCEGSGSSPEYLKLQNDWYGWDRPREKAWRLNIDEDDIAALIKEGRLWDFTRLPQTEEQKLEYQKHRESGGGYWMPENNGYTPTPAEVNEWAGRGMGHDASNCWICVKAKAVRLGHDLYCEWCDGGYLWPDEKYETLHDEWEWIQPPSGDAYQLWSTTSEGNPMSPPFATPEELARWLTDNKASSFGHFTQDYETWLNFIRGPGWAMSMMGWDGNVMSGVEFVSKEQGG